MKNYTIEPMDFLEFSGKVKVTKNKIIDFKKAFEKDIQEINKYALGPYFWFIPDNSNMTIVAVSDSIHTLTSLKKNEGKKYESNFLMPLVHPDDFSYVLGAIELMLKYLEKIQLTQRNHYRFNIYARIKNRNADYRWMVIQFPRIIYNQEGKGLSSLIVVSDISHFNIVNQPAMSLINSTSVKTSFQRASLDKNEHPLKCVTITKREREILALMINGYNSPEIVERLSISYHTVENHKRNLRHKTSCKTSAELVYFVLKNNLI